MNYDTFNNFFYGYNPVLIDNVVDTGLTAKSALEAIGGNTIVSFATRR